MSDTPKTSKLGFFKRVFNFRAWADWDRTQTISNYFMNTIRRLFLIQPAKASQIKSFEDVVAELKLTETDLIVKAKSLKRLCILMIVLACLFYSYGMYQLLYGSYLGVLLSLVLMCVTLALAFRYHFWYFQIRHRKLGCKISEWFKASFMDGGQ